MFVCLKGGMGTGVCPGSLLCLTNMSIFEEDPKSCEFPLQHYSGLGTLTIRQTFGNWYRKKLRLHYTKAKNFLTVFTEFNFVPSSLRVTIGLLWCQTAAQAFNRIVESSPMPLSNG